MEPRPLHDTDQTSHERSARPQLQPHRVVQSDPAQRPEPSTDDLSIGTRHLDDFSRPSHHSSQAKIHGHALYPRPTLFIDCRAGHNSTPSSNLASPELRNMLDHNSLAPYMSMRVQQWGLLQDYLHRAAGATDANFLYLDCHVAGVGWLAAASAGYATEEPISDMGQYVPKNMLIYLKQVVRGGSSPT